MHDYKHQATSTEQQYTHFQQQTYNDNLKGQFIYLIIGSLINLCHVIFTLINYYMN